MKQIKRIILNETEKKDILNLYRSKNIILVEQKWLRNLLGTSADDLVRLFGDDAIKNFETLLINALNKPINFVAKQGQTFIKSASGLEIPMTDIEKMMKLVSQKKISPSEVAEYLPSKLADGTEFRKPFLEFFSSKVGQNVAKSDIAPSWIIQKWFVKGHTQPVLADLFEKVNKLKNLSFDPKKIRVTNKTTQFGREILELKLPTGDDVLIYKSIGEGAPGLKQAGDWQLINGFVPDVVNQNQIKWFIKDEASTQLTKGLNQYATKLDEFLKKFGPDALGK